MKKIVNHSVKNGANVEFLINDDDKDFLEAKKIQLQSKSYKIEKTMRELTNSNSRREMWENHNLLSDSDKTLMSSLTHLQFKIEGQVDLVKELLGEETQISRTERRIEESLKNRNKEV